MPSLSSVLAATTFSARTKSLSTAAYLKLGAVEAAQFSGFTGDGSTDDILPLRAAVAAAISEGKGAVILPPTGIAISDTLFLGMVGDEDNNGYSLALIGSGGSGNHNGQSTRLLPSFDGTGVLVGPGQNMLVERVSVNDTTPPAYRGLMDSSRIGFGVVGGSGGPSGFVFRGCQAYGMHTGFKTGVDSDGLGDSGVLDKCTVDACAVGVHYGATQNYIQNIWGCTISAQTAVYAPLGQNVNIVGGNFSGGSGEAGKYTLSSVSAVTRTVDGNGATYSFTAHVDDPDANIPIFLDGCVNLAHFGLVPVTVTGYNSGTQVITLQVLRMWGLFHYQAVNLKTATDLDAINQANTTLYLAERVTMLHGRNFTLSGTMHLENSAAYTRLLEANSGFDTGTRITRINDLYCNWDVTRPTDNDADKQTAKRLIQKSHPFINLTNGGLIMDGVRLSQAAHASIIIDNENGNVLECYNPKAWNCPNVRSYRGQDPFVGGTPYEHYAASGVGDGVWEPTPFVPLTHDDILRNFGWNRTRYWGWFPAKDRAPRLAPSQLTALQGTLPTFTSGGDVGYPLICGGTLYSVGSETETNSGAPLFARSNHKGFSYGQNLTTTNITNLAWSFYGKTPKLVVNVEAFERLIPGLVLSLSHASINSGTAFEVIVTGLNYEELYVDVMAFSGIVLPGTAGTQYTGTTIGQAAYTFATTP